MLEPRWQKVRRDLWLARGRLALMIGAVAISLVAFGTGLGGYAVMTRELTRAYLATRPASATLETERLDASVVAAVRERPDVAAVEARATLTARARVRDEWRPLRLFVIADFEHMELATLARLDGAWPPPQGTLLLDHLAFSVLETRVGEPLVVRTPAGAPTELRVSGTVWDSSLAPAVMERTGWGYITPDTLRLLTGSDELDELKLVVRDGAMDPAAIEATARGVAAEIAALGHAVREIQIPPPGKHPHQGQLVALMTMLNVFALIALALSGVLVANTVAAMMTRQVQEIGVMKVLGAGRAQIAVLYGAMFLVVGLLAVLLAVPVATLSANALIEMAAHNLNMRIADPSIPFWVYATESAAGLLVPLLAAAVPVLRASRATVRQALDHADTAPRAGERRLVAALTRALGLGPTLRLGVRNAFRNRARLALSLALLAAGGAMFLTAANTRDAWALRLGEVSTSRRYDATLRFAHPVDSATSRSVVRSVRGVAAVEPLRLASGSWAHGGDIEVVQTYPDGGHGAFQVIGIDPEAGLTAFPLLSGRWLRADDEAAVVLNHAAIAERPELRVGERVMLFVAGRRVERRLVGTVRDIGSPRTAYLTASDFAKLSGRADETEMLALQTVAQRPEERARIIGLVERAIEQAGFGLALSVPIVVLENAVREHLAVLLGAIFALAGMMSLVAALGLAAAMGMSVTERTRELAVMRAVGATPRAILLVLLTEGLLVGLLSAAFAVALAVPLSAAVGGLIGRVAFRAALPLVMSPAAVAVGFAAALLLSGVATLVPALRAMRMSLHRALSFT